MHQCLQDSIVQQLYGDVKENKFAQKIARLQGRVDAVAPSTKSTPPTPTHLTPTHLTKDSSDEVLSLLVEHVPALPGLDDALSDSILKELDSMQLLRNPNKILTRWLSPTSDPYNYGKVVNNPIPIDNFPSIKKLMSTINNLPPTTCTGNMDSCLVSRYNNNRSTLRLHKDKEALISQDSSICTVSFGAPRSLEFIFDKSRDRQTPNITLPATNRTMNVMKPGCQAVMKHKVSPGTPATVNNTNWRYSLSFRKIVRPATPHSPDPRSPPTRPPLTTSPKEDLPKPPPANAQISSPPHKSVNLIAGDSFTARLDPVRLGRGKEDVINIAKGGLKISAIQQSLIDFSSSNPSTRVKKVFLSFGANDIRYCKKGIKHLKNPVGDIMKTAKTLFPDARIFVQSLPPVHPNGLNQIPGNVIAMNQLIFDRCSR